MMHRLLLVLSLLLPELTVWAQAFKPSADSLAIRPAIRALARQIVRESGGYYVRVRALDHPLCREATEDELVQLAEWPNGVVRCNAIECLALRQSPAFFPILRRHLYDADTVLQLMVGGSPIFLAGDLMLQSTNSQLSPAQKATIDSLLRFDPAIRLKAASDWLTRQLPLPNTYQRVRELANDPRHPARARATVALAGYRRPEDRATILRLLQAPHLISQCYGLWAVRRFPDPAFFPSVQALHARTLVPRNDSVSILLQCIYPTIISYQDLPSRELLRQALARRWGKVRRQHRNAMWLALKHRPSPIYSDLRIRPTWSKAAQKDHLSLDAVNSWEGW